MKHLPNILVRLFLFTYPWPYVMRTELPPTIDPRAAARWARTWHRSSPWLHEEVARRMEDRLQWMTLQPTSWIHWEPLRGGLEAQALLTKRYPKSTCYVVEASIDRAQNATELIADSWWNPRRWTGAAVRAGLPGQPVQMLWANMALHMAADPQSLIAQWGQLLAPEGFLMFSCLGPDTLRELREVYAALSWPPATHVFTDMHDWGDMLMHAGFSEPVMDMERITLSFTTPERLLQELRELGRNLHPERFAGLRGRSWYQQLCRALVQKLATRAEDGSLTLTFEVVYGHAFKPQPRLTMQPETTVTLDAMRASLRQVKKK